MAVIWISLAIVALAVCAWVFRPARPRDDEPGHWDTYDPTRYENRGRLDALRFWLGSKLDHQLARARRGSVPDDYTADGLPDPAPAENCVEAMTADSAGDIGGGDGD